MFENLDRQSYMLGRYKQGRRSGDENNVVEHVPHNEMSSGKDTAEASNAQQTKPRVSESIKPPGIEEDDESDEDLSYLL